MRRLPWLLVPGALLGCPAPADHAGDETDVPADVTCVPEPPAELLRHPGPQPDGSFLALDGRLASPPGPNTPLDGFPSRVVVHPTLPIAYVATLGTDDRSLLVVDLDRLEVVQTVPRGTALHGLAISGDGARVWAAGGSGGDVDVYEVGDDGTVTEAASIDVGGYASGLALSDDGAHAYVGLWLDFGLVEIDTHTLAVTRALAVPHQVWDVVGVPGRHEVYLGDVFGPDVTVVDVDAMSVVDDVEVPLSTAGMAASPDGATVWVASTRADVVTAIDTATREVTGSGRVALEDPKLADERGPLPNSNVNSVTFDAARQRLYATRGADNAIAVLDAETLAFEGAIPAPAYPTWSALAPDGDALVVVTGKGGGTGPNAGLEADDRNRGSVATIPLADLDLGAETQAVVDAFRRPVDLYDFDCEGTFPVPTAPGRPTPIEHVVLIVKENKTFDCYFGDLGGDADGEPSNALFGEDVTVNLHALARRYAISDNFYDQVDESDNGHLMLTQAHLTDLDEHANLEQDYSPSLTTYPISEAGGPWRGNLFTALIDGGVDFRVYGEIVGMFRKAADGTQPSEHSDQAYPGGPFLDQSVEDEVKARYVADRIAEANGIPTFLYVLLPDDHTVGTHPGAFTPESMVADNDYATGLVIDAIARTPDWDTTAIFVVQDDPQGCEDHVDAHRAFVIVAGPYARRGYVSHVQASFLSVHATILRILGLPPLGRGDAAAAPLYDLFTQEPDTSPFTVIERAWPKERNPEDAFGAGFSRSLDLSGADRDPRLGTLVQAYRLWRTGRITREEAERRLARAGSQPGFDEALDEAREEADAFERDFARLQQWQRERGLPVSQRPTVGR